KDRSGNAAAIAALSEGDGISGRFFQGAMKSSKRPSTKLQGKTKSQAPKAVSDCVPALELGRLEVGAFLLHFVTCANTAVEVKLWVMRLRYDLAMKVTPKMALEEA